MEEIIAVGVRTLPSTEGEHPVSAKCWGLRNRFVRWWVLGCTPDNPISTLPFEKSRIFLGANRVSAAFQPRFRRVSATFPPRFSHVSAHLRFSFLVEIFCDPKISAFLKVKLLVKLLVLVFPLRFSWQTCPCPGVLSSPSGHNIINKAWILRLVDHLNS